MKEGKKEKGIIRIGQEIAGREKAMEEFEEDLAQRQKRLFHTLDTDSNGIVDIQDVRAAFNIVGSPTPMEDAIDAVSVFGEGITEFTFEDFTKKLNTGPEPFKLAVLMIFINYTQSTHYILPSKKMKEITELLIGDVKQDSIVSDPGSTIPKGDITFDIFYKKIVQSYY